MHNFFHTSKWCELYHWRPPWPQGFWASVELGKKKSQLGYGFESQTRVEIIWTSKICTPLLPTGKANDLAYHIEFMASGALAPIWAPPISESAEPTRRYVRVGEFNAKCRHLNNLNKLTCKGALRQVFIRFYRLKPISCIHSVMLVVSTQLFDMYSPLLPLSFSLWFNSFPPSSVWVSTP